ncbi:MAG: DNA-processing protein DprA [Clostridia bacterium]|nr:DNA-processing protein DprA [Clostridia bacterium]
MEKNKIEIINYKDNRYPQKLNYINNKPIVLYMKGNMSNINNESVAVVGSRNCTIYGKKNADFFSYELAKRNVNVVSGLAKGIDAVAHSSCIRAKGKTIAVIGNGLDNIYPKENLKLAEKILENNGLIISEYVIGTKPEKENFPKRNRIISGISDAVIVVEASNKSGALITANYGIDQGKEVWAIPGNIYSYNSIGTNNLIKDGTNVLTSISDIIR